MEPLKTLEKTSYGTYAFEHRGMSIHDPMASECGRFRYDGSPEGFTPAEYGFEVVAGGAEDGKTAWRQAFALEGDSNRTVLMLLTDVESKTHAVKVREPVRITVLESDGITQLSTWLQDEGDLESTPPRLVRSAAQDEEILTRATDAALNEACRMIQEHLGIKYGDFASVYWTGTNESSFRAMLRAYMDAERADIASLQRRV